MKDIQKLLEDLSWDNPKDVVDTAINKLLQIDDEQVTVLLQPVNKSCWENAAKVLKMMGYPKNELALPGLLDWIRDMNWPGAQIAKEILFAIDKMILIPLVEDAVRKAYFEEDFIWIAGLREIVEEIGIEEFLNPRTSHLLNLEKLFLSDVQF